MNQLHPFRFGVLVHNASSSKNEWIASAQTAESCGYSTFLVPDHIGDQLAPAPILVTISEATTSLRVGTYVYDNDFRHPVLLAKEAATVDVLSGGRFELGIGAGWMRSEYDQSGLPFDPASVRVGRMEEALFLIKRLFAEGPVIFSGNYYTVNNLNGLPKPIQQPHPPILVGAGGRRMLSIAAREADIVGLVPKVQTDGSAMDMTDAMLAPTVQKIEWIRQAAKERFDQLELNIVLLAAVVTNDRRQIAEQIAYRLHVTGEQVLETPHCLVGTVDQISHDLWKYREQYGISYIVVWEESMKALAPVVAFLAGK